MAKRPKVKMNPRGAIAILKGNSVRADIQRRADAVAARAGDGFESGVIYGRTRVLGRVHAVTPDAMRAEAKDRALTRALDAAR